MSKNTKKSNKRKFWLYLIIAGIIVKIAKKLSKSGKIKDIEGNFADFIKKESKEVKELARGEEDINEFVHDTGSIFKNYFIPHSGNAHKPKILRSKSLITIAVFALLLKSLLVGHLFLNYPNQAKMTELITGKILELTNRDRVAVNLNSLDINSVLNISALAKADDMLANDYFAHTSPNGNKPWDWIDRGQYPYLFVGENLAMNFTTADSAHKALMNSESHKKNILNDRYSEIGIAMASGDFNGKDTSVFVEIFATRKVVPPALAKTDAETKPSTPPALLEDEPAEEKPAEPKEQPEPIKEEPVAPIAETKEEVIKELPKTNITDIAEPAETDKELAILPEGLQVISAETKFSPNPAIEQNKITEIKTFSNTTDRKVAFTANLLKVEKYFMGAILAFMILVLAVNILVRLRIQHKHVIAQTLLLILFITGLLYFNVHFLETGLPDILIL
ncbi:hypothetical protein K8R32_03870 [bacterium]|nr:hypothetical protein [bacterium]